MSPIMVGGDDSVIWKVHADRVLSTKTSSVGRKHDQEGVDETEEKGSFTVTIKLPSDDTAREEFLGQVRRFIENPRDRLVLRFPIEDKAYVELLTDKVKEKFHGQNKDGVYDQIQVEWPK